MALPIRERKYRLEEYLALDEHRLGGCISALRGPGEIATPCIEALLSLGAIHADLE